MLDTSRIKNVFLDAGGVILDEATHETARAELTVAIFRAQGMEYSLSDYWNDIDRSLEVFALHTYGFVFWKRSDGRVNRYEALWAEYRAAWEALRLPLVIMDGLEETLAALSSRYRVGILGQYGAALRERLEDKGLLKYFAFTTTQEQFGITKPDPRFFEQVLARAGVPASESCMVGDRIDKDITPAKMVGMQTIRTRTGIYAKQEPRVREEVPDAQAARVTDLPTVLL